MSTHTIAAISTGLTNSGISIVRMSGKDSLNIINKMFSSKSKLEPNKIVYGNIIKDNSVLDNVLVSYFKAPKSFTGEDIIEINCHGGIEITSQILEYVLECGATLAEPGEFSKRAFLNNKMDLVKAESIIDMINAKSSIDTKIFSKHLNGELSKKITNIREKLVELMAHISVSIDYPEYDYEELENSKINEVIDSVVQDVNKLISTYDQGKYIKNGVKVAILGKPNVGKSSLLNKLSKSEKAIVTNIPGTTRDIIEETITFGNLTLNILDTAGIRDTDDVIEKIGVEKSIKTLDEVDLVIYMFSCENEIEETDLEILSKIKNKGVKYVTLINKTDIDQKNVLNRFMEELKLNGIENIIPISVENENGIEELKNKLNELFNKNHLDYTTELIITNKRHKDLLKKSVEMLEKSKQEIMLDMPIDIISIYLKNATKYLGEIIGQDVSADVAKKIFEKFCIGK